MSIESATDLITTVGFPIFCVLALGAFIYVSYNRITEENKERENKLYEMLGKTQVQLDNAQETNSKFLSVLESINEETKIMKADINDIKETIKKLPKRKGDTEEE